MKLLRAINTDTNKKAVIFKEFTPIGSNQSTIGLDTIFDVSTLSIDAL